MQPGSPKQPQAPVAPTPTAQLMARDLAAWRIAREAIARAARRS